MHTGSRKNFKILKQVQNGKIFDSLSKLQNENEECRLGILAQQLVMQVCSIDKSSVSFIVKRGISEDLSCEI